MSETITIKIPNKKAKTILKKPEEQKVIEIVEDNISNNRPPKKKREVTDFFLAYKKAKLAVQGKIKLKTADELIDELQKSSKSKNSAKKSNHLNSFLKSTEE